MAPQAAVSHVSFNNIVGAPGCQLRLPIVSIILFDAALRYRELVTLIADLALQSPFERGRNFREVPGLENESALKFAPRRWAAKHQLCHFSMSANYSLARYANSAGRTPGDRVADGRLAASIKSMLGE
jgi:hypothetical protein